MNCIHGSIFYYCKHSQIKKKLEGSLISSADKLIFKCCLAFGNFVWWSCSKAIGPSRNRHLLWNTSEFSKLNRHQLPPPSLPMIFPSNTHRRHVIPVLGNLTIPSLNSLTSICNFKPQTYISFLKIITIFLLPTSNETITNNDFLTVLLLYSCIFNLKWKIRRNDLSPWKALQTVVVKCVDEAKNSCINDSMFSRLKIYFCASI